jgi:lipopolysaccharide transport system permease protein
VPSTAVTSTAPSELRPLVIIEPSPRWVALRLRDVVEYHELLFFLIWRDVKVRYKQTALGIAWAVLQPLATMAIFTLLFGRLAKMPSDGIPYPLFVLSGLLLWLFFANAITMSGNSLIGNANLITKIYFPRIIIPAAAVGAGLVDLVIGLGLLCGAVLWFRYPIAPSILLLPVPIALATLLAVGVGMWMSALNVRFRDIRYVLPFMIQLWMFATPIIYPPSVVPLRWRWVLDVNPFTGIVDSFRAALFNRPVDLVRLGISAAVTIIIAVLAAYDFRRMERTFADLI